MPRQFSRIQKLAFGFAALFLGVYLLDYVPGIMDQNGLMFGLFHMTKIVDIGHLALGALALIAALSSARIARIYFWMLGIWYTIDVVTFFVGHLHSLRLVVNILTNLPHLIVFLAAYWIALNVDKPKAVLATGA
ncbi:MAG: hypothetical protein WAL95_13275 [Candidatus Acidiferrales bacterium]